MNSNESLDIDKPLKTSSINEKKKESWRRRFADYESIVSSSSSRFRKSLERITKAYEATVEFPPSESVLKHYKPETNWKDSDHTFLTRDEKYFLQKTVVMDLSYATGVSPDYQTISNILVRVEDLTIEKIADLYNARFEKVAEIVKKEIRKEEELSKKLIRLTDEIKSRGEAVMEMEQDLDNENELIINNIEDVTWRRHSLTGPDPHSRVEYTRK